MDSRAHVSLEYLLIFLISLSILSMFSIPLIEDTVSDVNDIKKSMDIKNTLIELSNNVNLVYASGYGSKKTISMNIPCNMNIYYKTKNSRHYLYSYCVLSDNTKKEIEVEIPCRVSFNNKPTYYYTSLKKQWYYNIEVKWIEYNDDYFMNIDFR